MGKTKKYKTQVGDYDKTLIQVQRIAGILSDKKWDAYYSKYAFQCTK